MNWKKLVIAIKQGFVAFFTDEEETEEPPGQEEEIELSLKGLMLFLVLMISLGLAVYGIRLLLHSYVKLPTDTHQQEEIRPPGTPLAAKVSTPEPTRTVPAFTDKIIKSLEPIEVLDIGSKMDQNYIDKKSFRDAEEYPIIEGDTTFRWTKEKVEFIMPLPRNKEYRALDFHIGLPPNKKAIMQLKINDKEYPPVPIESAVKHYYFPLEKNQISDGIAKVLMNIEGNPEDNGVQLLKVRVLEQMPTDSAESQGK